MSSVEEDPLDWTVEEVIQFLCHDPETPWSQSATNTPRPNPAAFEATLRENMITGEVLLNDVDKEALRDDLGLKAIGHRSTILMAIRYLRRKSPKYKDSQMNHGSPFDGRTSFSGTPRTAQAPFSPFHESSLIAATPQDSEPVESGKNRPAEPSSSSRLEQPNPAVSAPQIRSGEHLIVDSGGRKRRKLELAQTNEVQVADTTVKVPSLSPDQSWYMGPDRILSSELFYPLDADEDGESFVLASPRFPTAQSRFVNKSLNYFYRQQPIKLNGQTGNSQWALFPYKPTKSLRSRSRHFTLYTSRNGEVSTTKENAEEWPQFSDLQPVGSEAPTPDPYSHLIQKYPAEEDDQGAYPVYGDSESDGEYDDETWQEIEHEKQEKPSKLGPAEIDSIIEDCIAQYESKWQQDSQPREERKARHLWLNARKGRCTNQKIKAFTSDIALQENQLKRLKSAIKAECESRTDLRAQCRNLEQTVFNIQTQKWRVSVLERQACPPRIDAAPRPQPIPKSRVDEDEESLHSESDGFLDDDSSDVSVADFTDHPDVDERIQPDMTPNTRSASSDDVVLPSANRQILRAQKEAITITLSEEPTLPVEHEIGQVADEPIDLTADSPGPDDLTIETPPLNPVDPKMAQSRDVSCKDERDTSVSPMPDSNSRVTVEVPHPKPSQDDLNTNDSDGHSSLENAEERRDRRKFLRKLVSGMPDDERKLLTEAIPSYEVQRLQKLVRSTLKQMLKSRMEACDLGNSIRQRTASLYIQWTMCERHGTEGVPKSQVREARSSIEAFPTFFNELCMHLTNHKRKAQADSDRESTQSPSLLRDPNTHTKKRKRETKESQDAKRSQENAMQRVAHQNKQREALEQRMARNSVSNADPGRQAVAFRTPEIYLDSHIGQRIKPHQLKGIQFMWRELIEDEKRQGCLLAHTMGLGKTMQVISLLVTIAAAAASDDKRVRQQVPADLRRSQTLVICPSSLIENWYEEFLMWTPRGVDIGPIRKINPSTAPQNERLQETFDWNEEGGILIISYDIFRILILNNETKARQRRLGNDDHQRIKDCLLKGPNIIVADEAHKMKNPRSGIANAAGQFRSRTRIALTGSPLTNNLNEYFSMVDWISHGYLGKSSDFKENYVNPIEKGLYAESEYTERRRSRVKLQVLKEILEPKIDRVDIAALEGSLPPKVEFVITVPLTELQQKAYDTYVESVNQAKADASNTAIWSWLSNLGLCCNHPACFRDKLLDRANDAAKAVEAGLETIPGDEPIGESFEKQDLSDRLVSKEKQIFAAVPDMKALNLSHRAQMLDKIVTLSIEAGDKVLVFSHSLPTLNFIEDVLKDSKYRYRRLDGSTPMHGRQAATKKFNTGSEDQVYLISTRAGGLGLNIPGANRVVIFDFTFSPMWEEQAVGRAYRLGQQKPVFVYRFISGGTFEEVMHNKAVFKADMASRVVDKKNPMRKSSKWLREYLFPVKSVEQADISECTGKDTRVLDRIISSNAGTIRKIALTETFQIEDHEKLTEEEKKDAQQQLDDELLKRNNPVAYERLLRERQAESNRTHVQGPPWMQMSPQYPPHFQLPPNAHNAGPPPLTPDISVAQPRPLNSIPRFSQLQAHGSAQNPASRVINGSSRPSQIQPTAQTTPSQSNPLAEKPNQQPSSEVSVQKEVNGQLPQSESTANHPRAADENSPEAPQRNGYTTAPSTPA